VITFKELTYTNFLATGANAVTIQLNKAKSTLIVGTNGSGKSTILDALSFGLFGKAHRNVSKQLLVNSINGKGCVVSISFEASGQEFKIIRGIKPNIFEVWQNGEMIDQSASMRDYQKFLEQNILKLNHKSFHQIVVLGSSSFVPFMQLSTHHRREVVEDLLDINVFSRMRDVLRDRNNGLKVDVKDERNNLEVYKGKYEYQKKYVDQIEELNVAAKASSDEEISKLKLIVAESITKGVDLTKKARDYPSDLTTQLASLVDDHISLVVDKTNNTTELNRLMAEHKFFSSNDECPTCAQDISAEFKVDKIGAIQDSGLGLDKVARDVLTGIDSNETKQAVLTNTIAELRGIMDSISDSQASLVAAEAEISLLEGKEGFYDLTDAYTELNGIQKNADECRDTLDEHNQQTRYNEVAGEMLKDTGIRTKVIREYLPAMNTLINQYLQTLDFFVAFTLDENFEETLKSRHRDKFKYDNFSEGEKQRIDLSLLFTWRQIAKMKNSTNTNLLILDETFDSSLDTDGVDNLMRILHSLGDDTNTFVISHKPDLLESKLRDKITFCKKNNFSEVLR
jgi:DNA repair exonuclease SbcCD ATPase subunit